MEYYHKSKFDLYIDNSSIVNSGLGVFTKTFIPKDSFIDEYYGEIIDYLFGGDYYFKIDKDYGINAEKFPRCYMAMLNDASYVPKSNRQLKKFVKHDYKNNCVFKVDEINKKVYVVSKVDIPSKSELFISYGDEYWQ
jgi:hypothetical protein